jgi:outer membrane protein TolC
MGRVIALRFAASGTCAALALAACAVGPNFKTPTPPDASGYGSASPPPETASTPGASGDGQHFLAGMDIPYEWWRLFQSPQLDLLVAQALKSNPDVASAEAALRQAHELYLAQRTALFPLVQGSFGATRAENPLATLANPTSLPQGNPYYSLYTAQLSLTYLPDVFGGTRRSIEAARAQAEVGQYQLRPPT